MRALDQTTLAWMALEMSKQLVPAVAGLSREVSGRRTAFAGH